MSAAYLISQEHRTRGAGSRCAAHCAHRGRGAYRGGRRHVQTVRQTAFHHAVDELYGGAKGCVQSMHWMYDGFDAADAAKIAKWLGLPCE